MERSSNAEKGEGTRTEQSQQSERKEPQNLAPAAGMGDQALTYLLPLRYTKITYRKLIRQDEDDDN